ncbi:MAG: class I poly(R)-hydroxyalkanoic acid synthase [Gammaproteobacteria bacterium]|nr:class I poly(R)-hydroxyalkanoic acid synthase [Gammaproteobacteria bacterium]
MTDASNDPITPEHRTAEVSRMLAEIGARSQRLVDQFVQRQCETHPDWYADPLGVSKSFMELCSRMLAQPEVVLNAQLDAWQSYMALWHHTTRRMLGMDSEAPLETPAGDRRFRHDQWEDNPVFDYVKQSYLLAARTIQGAVNEVQGLDEKSKQKIDFYTRQFVDALAPTNFAMTNPEVIAETVRSGGQNLLNGLRHILEDLEAGEGRLQIRMTDTEAFDLGRNVALSPGKVVYQNELMQLIQYAPSTAEVYRRPLLIMPPWINKFYILDLQPRNSFIKWAVDQGHTVFVISWVNPDARHRDKDFEDYMLEGPIAALDAIGQATGEREVNVIGYCIGGTLLAGTLAWMQARGDDRVVSATFFTALIDFADPGELGVFIDEEQLRALEQEMSERGYLEGKQMATTFNMLRANDLIWSFVVNNYLLGKDPFPFDLLYWNSDTTRMPAKMHSFYLRRMYLENVYKDPGGVTLAGVPIDVRTVKVPVYFLSTREDHIAPWKSTYAGARLLGGPVRFTVGGSGHIAGVVNPPAANKYGYWTRDGVAEQDPQDWLAGAEEHQGSWWSDWERWIATYGGGRVAAREPGAGALPAIEDAPGSYVRAKSTD